MLKLDDVIEQEDLVREAIIKQHVNKIANAKINISALCSECGCTIDKKRLEVLPQAMMCIECAVENEKKTTFYKRVGTTRGIFCNMTS